MPSARMNRVSRQNPCPICGKPDWCLVADDGSAAICPRTQEGSAKKCGDSGYLHILRDRHDGHNRHKRGARRRHLLKGVPIGEAKSEEFVKLATRYQRQLSDERLDALATSLGVSSRSIRRLRVGWDGRAYTFPMSDGLGKTVGIRRRFPNGKKVSAESSTTGLFVPTDLRREGPLLICEGATDTAAALDLGFNALGRQNCNSKVQMTAKAAGGWKQVVIVGDADRAGRRGAGELANLLTLQCPCVTVLFPPDGVKDLRQWLNQGLTAEAFREIVAATPTVRLSLRFSRLGQTRGVRR